MSGQGCGCPLCAEPLPSPDVQTVEEAAAKRQAWLRARGSRLEEPHMIPAPPIADRTCGAAGTEMLREPSLRVVQPF